MICLGLRHRHVQCLQLLEHMRAIIPSRHDPLYGSVLIVGMKKEITTVYERDTPSFRCHFIDIHQIRIPFVSFIYLTRWGRCQAVSLPITDKPQESGEAFDNEVSHPGF